LAASFIGGKADIVRPARYGRKLRRTSCCALTCCGAILLGGAGLARLRASGTLRGISFVLAFTSALPLASDEPFAAAPLSFLLSIALIGGFSLVAFRRLTSRLRRLLLSGFVRAWIHGRGYLFCRGRVKQKGKCGMWGIPGAILAVPMLAIAKIICDRLRPLAAFGHFLEG